ncbi:MAG: hypothetical protein ACRC9O_12765 [Plesiomonas sp.]|uniref:hypothetical protein n=1 Tax=Plesiomonas sp. TaxID=2486279 RepID=UPI003F3F1406
MKNMQQRNRREFTAVEKKIMAGAVSQHTYWLQVAKKSRQKGYPSTARAFLLNAKTARIVYEVVAARPTLDLLMASHKEMQGVTHAAA